MSNAKLSNNDIVLYALDLCGGVQKKIHTEHIANQAYELASDRFSWKHFPYPDKEIVRRRLFDLRTESRGALVEGRAGIEAKGQEVDGWQITKAGAEWLNINKTTIAQQLKVPQKEANRYEREAFEKRIWGSAAYKKFVANGEIDAVKPFEFTEMLRCSPDASAEIMRKKLDHLCARAVECQSDEITRFLEACEKTFQNLLKRN